MWVIAVLVKPLSVLLPGRRPDRGVRLLRWGAGMAAAAAVILLGMAFGTVEFSDHEPRSRRTPPRARLSRRRPRLVGHLVGHRTSYLPPAFNCALDDGTTYPGSGVCAWLDGLVVAFAVASVLRAVGARYTTDRQIQAPNLETPE
ncbi:hypothetical protein WJ438_30995 [Streptomyces sp. GD-15H]|uniref:hypothetical protein n=1 Tax=Streptomyces sp. GD-15H TaxID=3129112 RepID=UPI0032456687